MKAIYETKGKAREYFELAVNLFSGCGHACTYCYGADVTHQNWDDFSKKPHPRRGILSQLETDAQRLAGREKRAILMCFVTDPYQPIETETQLTKKAIEILKKYGLRIALLSKGGLRATRDLVLLNNKDWFGSTLTLIDEDLRFKYEPIADTTSNRLKSLSMAHDMGIPTWVSCEPVIDTEQTLQLIEKSAPFVDVFKVGKLNYAPTPKVINWRKFAFDSINLLNSLGKRYYIKKDLAAFIGQPKGIDRGKCS